MDTLINTSALLTSYSRKPPLTPSATDLCGLINRLCKNPEDEDSKNKLILIRSIFAVELSVPYKRF